MSKFGSNPFVKLTEMLSDGVPQIAAVSAVNSDGTVTVSHRGGGSSRLRASQTFTVGDQVIVKGDTAAGKAPSLPSANASI